MFGDLQQGSSGAAVSQLQSSLVTLGYDVGPTGVDGIFGNYTDGAVRKFQSDAGLDVDGIVGPDTLAALGRELSGGPITTTNAPGAAVPAVMPPKAPVAQASMFPSFPAWMWLGAIAGAAYFMFFQKKGKRSKRRAPRRVGA